MKDRLDRTKYETMPYSIRNLRTDLYARMRTAAGAFDQTMELTLNQALALGLKRLEQALAEDDQ